MRIEQKGAGRSPRLRNDRIVAEPLEVRREAALPSARATARIRRELNSSCSRRRYSKAKIRRFWAGAMRRRRLRSFAGRQNRVIGSGADAGVEQPHANADRAINPNRSMTRRTRTEE